MDFIEKGRDFLNFVNDDKASVILVAFPQQRRAADIFRQNIGFQQINNFDA